ncbi:MAG: peptide chain release factor N(5)-glutamine methyltransferase [Verrucomicrobiota bacterium]
MTVLDGIQKSADFLGSKGVDSPRLQAELLLAHVLQLPRMQLYLKFDRPLSEDETNRLRELVRRRGRREPLQHLVGSACFCGWNLEVNPHVLIPRPETELLAESAWTFLESRGDQPVAVLDFGTGSGCLAIAIAARLPAARVTALDISTEAIEVARRNARAHQLETRIEFFHGDGWAALTDGAQFDLIVSNPPYIPSEEIPSLQPEVRDFDPRLALDGGTDGLDFYRLLATGAGARLKSGGKIMLEFGDGQSASIRSLFENQKWIVEAVRDDYTQRPRILIAHPGA